VGGEVAQSVSRRTGTGRAREVRTFRVLRFDKLTAPSEVEELTFVFWVVKLERNKPARGFDDCAAKIFASAWRVAGPLLFNLGSRQGIFTLPTSCHCPRSRNLPLAHLGFKLGKLAGAKSVAIGSSQT
jgi:hypothetical protein